jgi:protocatechuate 3,4-dioxygenase, beta subunit
MRSIGHLCRMMVDADEGPFYPVVPIPLHDDLTYVESPALRAAGETIYMFGRVAGPDCTPVAGARVEIWQADRNGQYVHPRAPKQTPIDPHFRYFAAVRTGGDGVYRFRTLRPAPYQVFGLRRAAHIHVRVKAPGYATSTSEIYFAGADDDTRRAGDRVFKSRGSRRDEMIVPARRADSLGGVLPSGMNAADPCYEYDLSVRTDG